MSSPMKHQIHMIRSRLNSALLYMGEPREPDQHSAIRHIQTAQDMLEALVEQLDADPPTKGPFEYPS